MIENLKYLENFETIGQWVIDDSRKSNKSVKHLSLPGIRANIDKSKQNLKDVIYIFKTKDRIVYIGETSRELKERFYAYGYGFDIFKDTDNRVKIGLTELLKSGQVVDILIWKPETIYTICGEEILIPLSKPLEEFLIKKISPISDIINNKGIQKINKEIIEKIFLDSPESWGLRGDPFLWEELKENMMNTSDDLTYFNFKDTLKKKINDLIDSKGEINESGQIYFSSYPQDGMSGGYISKEWWEENGIPTLISRLKTVVNI